MFNLKKVVLIIAPIIAVTVAWVMIANGHSEAAAITAAVTIVCAFWWVFEPIAIPFTSLLPLALFPLFGVLTPQQVGQAYGHWLILLLMGGFMISTAMAKSGAHRRIALKMVHLFGGTNPLRLVLGFMAASALLSMWISNTATTLMLLPVALAVLERAPASMAVPLLLGIAYAASVGGMGTPIGTPPNLIFMSVYEDTFEVAPTFLEWMGWGLPVVVVFIPLIALWLTRKAKIDTPIELPDPGRWQQAEIRVMIVFALTALAWMTRATPFGGWRQLLNLPQANDASVALLAVVVLALIPDGRGGQLLDWKTARKIPWGVLILFGGGICIASAFVQSGLADILAQQLGALSSINPILMVIIVCLSVTFLTEITSNTATSSLLMPLLAAAAVAGSIDPRLLMVPAAMSASCAFMLPVATAPNAIIFGSGRVSIKTMTREGFVLNLMGAVIISAMSWLLLM